MKNIQILDCTLRDGGRVINCAFHDSEIRGISQGLDDSGVDIVEVGFLRDKRSVNYSGNSTFFTDTEQIAPFIPRTRKALYTAFIDYGMFDFDSLKPHDPSSIDAIRFGFTKKDYDSAKNDLIRCMRLIKEMGYKLFIQGVNSLNYSDIEILELVSMVNEIEPYSFGIVDTYGAMYSDDVSRLYGLIDHNMKPSIRINFHSHNNYQLSFSFAQEVIKLSGGVRKLIIDSTLSGMGKVAGNLCTELIADYLIRKLHYDYDLDTILDIIDTYIYQYSLRHKWGYSVPAMMAGIYKSHPNNIIYLTEKFRLATKDIGKILAMIDPVKRQRYDYDNIERLYMEYTAYKVDDSESVKTLREIFSGREILILVPGKTFSDCYEDIREYAKKHNPIVISVNFLSDLPGAYAFYGNSRRYIQDAPKHESGRIIITSNILPDSPEDVITVNYYSLINRGYKYFENSAIMLLNLLRRVGVQRITFAGFDGFSPENENNFSDSSFQNDRYIDSFSLLNKELNLMLHEYYETVKDKCEIKFLTPSQFEEAFR